MNSTQNLNVKKIITEYIFNKTGHSVYYKVDIIIDIKGCLWYKRNRMEVLDNYSKVLKENGIIIIDGGSISKIRYIANLVLYQLSFCNIVHGYMENSTYQKLYLHIKNSKKLSNYINQNFIIKEYDLVSYKKQKIKVATLAKKVPKI